MENGQSVFFFLSPHTPYGRARLARFWRARLALTPRFTDFFTDFWEKNRLFCSLIRRTSGSVCRYNETIPPSQSQSLLLTTDHKFHNLRKWNVLFQNRIIAPMIAKPFPSMSQHTKMLQKSRDPSGYFQVSDDLQKVAHYLPLLRRLSNNAEFRVWLSQVSWYLFTQLTSNWIFDSFCYRNKITVTVFCEMPPAALHLWIWQDYHEKKIPTDLYPFFCKGQRVAHVIWVTSQGRCTVSFSRIKL